MFFKYLFDNISAGTIGFSVEAIGIMATSVFYANISLGASGDHLRNEATFNITLHLHLSHLADALIQS